MDYDKERQALLRQLKGLGVQAPASKWPRIDYKRTNNWEYLQGEQIDRMRQEAADIAAYKEETD